MSFYLTQPQIRNQTKTVTRRKGWAFLAVGDQLQPIVKGQGLKKGQQVERIGAPIEIVNLRWERLCAITPADVIAEGFPEKTPEEFIGLYIAANGGDRNQLTHRIEFAYTEPMERTYEEALEFQAAVEEQEAQERKEWEEAERPQADYDVMVAEFDEEVEAVIVEKANSGMTMSILGLAERAYHNFNRLVNELQRGYEKVYDEWNIDAHELEQAVDGLRDQIASLGCIIDPATGKSFFCDESNTLAVLDLGDESDFED